MSLHWTEQCSKCNRRVYLKMRGWRLCKRHAEKEGKVFADVRRALIHLRYGTDPAGYTPDVLRELAAGPIGDPLILYAPAGKLSMAETKQREMAAILDRTE